MQDILVSSNSLAPVAKAHTVELDAMPPPALQVELVDDGTFADEILKDTCNVDSMFSFVVLRKQRLWN